MSGTRIRILYLAELFLSLTDELHLITLNDIICKLSERGCEVSRKAIYADINALKQFGMDIRYERKKGHSGYHVINRKFDLAEIKIMMDAINSSQFLTNKKTHALIKKLNSLCSYHEANSLKNGLSALNIAKNENEGTYYNIDLILAAINKNKMIEFDLFDYDIEKKKWFRKGRRKCSPYSLIWNDGRYYVVAFYEKYSEAFTNFRIDRMDNIIISDESAVPLPQGFDIDIYLNETFFMYSGKTKNVILEFQNSNNMMNIVIDRFGKNIIVIPQENGTFRVSLMIKPETTFMGWIFGLEDKVKIIAPEELREEYEEHLKNVLYLYKK